MDEDFHQGGGCARIAPGIEHGVMHFLGWYVHDSNLELLASMLPFLDHLSIAKHSTGGYRYFIVGIDATGSGSPGFVAPYVRPDRQRRSLVPPDDVGDNVIDRPTGVNFHLVIHIFQNRAHPFSGQVQLL